MNTKDILQAKFNEFRRSVELKIDNMKVRIERRKREVIFSPPYEVGNSTIRLRGKNQKVK